MTIPEGAIGRNQTEEVFIAALREDKDRPVLLGKPAAILYDIIIIIISFMHLHQLVLS